MTQLLRKCKLWGSVCLLLGGSCRWGRRIFLVFFFFSSLFFVFLCFSSLFFVFFVFLCFFSYSVRGQGKTTAIYCKVGKYLFDPICTDPVQNFPILKSVPLSKPALRPHSLQSLLDMQEFGKKTLHSPLPQN